MGAGGPSGIGGAGDGASYVVQPSEPQPTKPTADEKATGRGTGAHAKTSGGRPGSRPPADRSVGPQPGGPTSDGVRDGAKLDPRVKHETFTDPATGKTRHRVTYPPPPRAEGQQGPSAAVMRERGLDRAMLNDLAALGAVAETVSRVASLCQAAYSPDPRVRERLQVVCGELDRAQAGFKVATAAEDEAMRQRAIRNIR